MWVLLRLQGWNSCPSEVLGFILDPGSWRDEIILGCTKWLVTNQEQSRTHKLPTIAMSPLAMAINAVWCWVTGFMVIIELSKSLRTRHFLFTAQSLYRPGGWLTLITVVFPREKKVLQLTPVRSTALLLGRACGSGHSLQRGKRRQFTCLVYEALIHRTAPSSCLGVAYNIYRKVSTTKSMHAYLGGVACFVLSGPRTSDLGISVM